MTGDRAPDRAVVVIGMALVAIALVVGWQATTIRNDVGVQAIGPRMMPYLVGGFLGLMGALTIIEGLRGRAPAREKDDWTGVGWVAGGLAAMIVLVTTAGFTPAAAALFAATARAFGSRRWPLDLAIGAVLGLSTFLFFSRGLGLTLPSGLAERLF